MAEALQKTEKGTAWLVATGAMTNVAQLFISHPTLAEHIKGLSIMGGAIGDNFTSAVMGRVDDRERIGNWSAWAEFNILVDPEAAAALFDNPILAPKMVMIPLDVTHLVLATKEIQTVLLHGETPGKFGVTGRSILRTMLVELLMFFAKTYADVFGITEGPPLHDPLAVAAVLDGIEGEEIPFYDFKGEGRKRERYKVQVVTDGTHDEALKGAQTGRTIATLLPEGEEGVKVRN
jgi:uridine nucleosidase